jgi:hypothetical protein
MSKMSMGIAAMVLLVSGSGSVAWADPPEDDYIQRTQTQEVWLPIHELEAETVTAEVGLWVVQDVFHSPAAQAQSLIYLPIYLSIWNPDNGELIWFDGTISSQELNYFSIGRLGMKSVSVSFGFTAYVYDCVEDPYGSWDPETCELLRTEDVDFDGEFNGFDNFSQTAFNTTIPSGGGELAHQHETTITRSAEVSATLEVAEFDFAIDTEGQLSSRTILIIAL